MEYKSKPDKRNTSNGMIPNKAIRRPSNPPTKKPLKMNYKRGG